MDRTTAQRASRVPRRGELIAGAVTGLVAAGVALAAGELVALFTGAASAPVDAVASVAVNLSPAGLKEFAIRNFGTNDKQMLITGILVVLAVVAVLAGIGSLRRLAVGIGFIAVFAALGAWAELSLAGSDASAVAPPLAGGVAGAAVLTWLVTLYRGRRAAGAGRTPDEAVHEPSPSPSRRGFVAASASTAVAAAAVGFGTDLWLGRGATLGGERAAVRIPRPARPAPALPRTVHPNVAGLSSFFTPNGPFYRVDTALVLPAVDPGTWTLRVHGLVDRPLELSFRDLLRMPLEEHDMTLSCVSNPVGGPYVGNARWVGASLAPILRSARVRSGATQLVARSVDGMTIGTPVESVLDGRASLVAVGMNGEALPVKHGFPARVLVPGFYGYASACKWVTELEVTTYQAYTTFWVNQGYDRVGAMKISSRIDVPRPSTRPRAGHVTVAGIAWATHRGISAVQVRVDGGPWNQARLAAQDSPDTWRQWTYDWQATSGTHNLQVRAIDGRGVVQTGAHSDAFPSGATGWHTVGVTVT